MNHYLMKYKGVYRILPELDEDTHDFPRDKDGGIADGYDDLYISCYHGNKIYFYGHGANKRVILSAYIPSIGRGRNVKKAMDVQGITYTNYLETDTEVEFRFRAKDIEVIAGLLKAKTAGSDISPFSVKNLPKNKNTQIPSNEIARYREITGKVQKDDLLLIHTITVDFLNSVLQKKYRKYDKTYDFRIDMKRMKMARQTKEFIYEKGLWHEYLKFLDNKITDVYKEKEIKV